VLTALSELPLGFWCWFGVLGFCAAVCCVVVSGPVACVVGVWSRFESSDHGLS